MFVLNKNKKPLNPCHPAKARKLLKQGKAVIYKKYPFTIRLKELKETEEDDSKEYRLKIDYGSRYTGLSILDNDNVLWLAEIHHRTNIKKKMDNRRAFRRRRRCKNLRYRKSRFNNRKRKEGWLPPSLQSRVDNIGSWVNKLIKLVPLTHISYENCWFDIQLMRNPEISGIEYQQGKLKGYEVREYLLEKFDRKCIYCGVKNVPLEIEHLIPKSRGGSNRVDNLGIACRKCNQSKDNKTPEEFGYPNIHKQIQKPLRDVAIINVTRWKIYETLIKTGLQVECGAGALTKINRTNLDLPKTHYFDACSIGKSTPDKLYFKTNNVLYIRAKGRGSYCRTNLNKYGFPRGYLSRQKFFFGFQTGDMIKAIVPKGKHKGVWHGEVACRRIGRFDIKNNRGERIAQGIGHKSFNLIQYFDGYSYRREEMG